MADIGYIALFLASAASLYSAVAFAVGGKRGNPRLVESGRNALLVAFGLVTISVAGLLVSLVTHDFQVQYVADYTSRNMSLPYLLSGLWAGNSGSLLTWVWLLTIFGTVFVVLRRDNRGGFTAYASSVTMVATAFFIILTLAVANPFQKFTGPAPTDGAGLNPLLENPGMLIHPIALLAGYVAITIPFAVGMAALLRRRLDSAWVVTVRRWALVAWMLLGLGNLIGAWWAYVELGWGGYWAWDPVENAGLMPWLVLTAFLHSISMQRRRGIFKLWNIVLITLAFNLSVFGTMLTRTDVINSPLHGFTEGGAMLPYFLFFIGLSVVVPLILIYRRRSDFTNESEVESLVSREGTFFLNNVLMVGATAVILVGTLFPLLSQLFEGAAVDVGSAFFDRVTGPIFLAVIFLAGICTTIGWRRASGRNLVRNLLWPGAAALVITVVSIIVGVRGAGIVIAFIGCFLVGTILYEWGRGTIGRHRAQSENVFGAFWNLIRANRTRYGGYVVHIGIAVFAVGVIGSSLYSVRQQATLQPGQALSIGPYTLTYDGNMKRYDNNGNQFIAASLTVRNGAAVVGRMTPLLERDDAYATGATQVAIRSTPANDLYVIPVFPVVRDAAQNIAIGDNGLIEVYSGVDPTFVALLNPLVMWLWIGGGMVIFGGLLAFWPHEGPSALFDQRRIEPGGAAR